MTSRFPQQLFVTGTDTDIGKTVISAMLTLGLQAAYWKPIQAGFEPESDLECVRRLTKLPKKHFFPESYRLTTPLSPHVSAHIDGINIEMDKLNLPEHNDFSHLIVEGCGGCMVPLNDKGDMIIDLIAKWAIPTLIVCRSTLGTINQTLLTLQQLRAYEIPIEGVFLNGPKNPSNRHAIETFGKVKIIGEIEPQKDLNPRVLQNLFDQLPLFPSPIKV